MAFALLALGWEMSAPFGDWPSVALARTVEPARAADAPPSPGHVSAAARHAPSQPPLSMGEGAESGGGREDAGSTAGVEADPLVSNGLDSPLCRGALGEGELSAAGSRDCRTSGFVAAAAPTGDYGIDVNIDTGVLGLSSDGLLGAVQELFVTPVWMALVWAVHALVVMLEWCFTIDVLDSAVAGGLGKGLRDMQAAFTVPLLACVLALASMLALYNGLIRRRVAETLGQALVMTAMIVGGLWVIADPTGTVGALGQWVNSASLGALATAARGTPSSPGRALGESMDAVFAAVIEAPWCYMEFGDVGWCREPARLDPRLRAAGLAIAAGELSLIGCKPSSAPLAPSLCVARGSGQAQALEHSAQLLREAHSNGAVFLALPANGAERNASSRTGSLLWAICQSSDATSCRGPTAAQAEFRTGGQTWSRVGGLLLIVAGVLGMMLLLGFIALRLLTAAIFSLLYLLLAPAMVLAPALGEGGREVFRKWATQLIGAVVSKLLFSFLLGTVLAVGAVLSSLPALGWWTQWLLMSAFWWGAYAHRHQALGAAEGALTERRHASGRAASAHTRGGSIVGRLSDALDPPRRAIGLARGIRGKLGGAAPSVEGSRGPRSPRREQVKSGIEGQAKRMLEAEHREAGVATRAAPAVRASLSARRSQLERVEREQGKARGHGERRRAIELGDRGARLRAGIERDQERLNSARIVNDEGKRARRDRGEILTRARLESHDRFLDTQAALPARGRPSRGSGERRDYAALAPLAVYGREQYRQLDPQARRAARLVIDRELALRRERGGLARLEPVAGMPSDGQAAGGHGRQRRRVDRTEGAMRAAFERSSVMRDAREVAARRKRQLGTNRR